MKRASHESIHANSTLADLPTASWVVDASTPTDVVKAEFDRRPDLPGAIVLSEGRLSGIVARDTFFRRLSGPYCRELFLRKPIKDFLTIWPIDVLTLPSGSSIHSAAELALARPNEHSYEPILVDYGNGDVRLLDTHTLLIAQSQLLALSKVIADQRDAAEAANRSKSEFLANISHELRTPLHGILSYAQFGVEEAEAGDRGELRQFFDNVGRSAETLLDLVNDLLDLSKLEAGRMMFHLQPACMTSLIEVVVDEFRSMIARKDVRITYCKPDETMIVPADEERFKQVLRNLLSNAVKFSPAGGTIHVRSRRIGKTCLISVRDEGPGIPPDELEMVFDKFMQSSQTKSGSGGTGLGLAICREIVAGHHGRIWAENNAPQGCTFYCELPLAPAAEDDDFHADGDRTAATAAVDVGGKPMTAKGRILIVDDISTNVDILRRILRKDFDLDWAASGEECLARLPAFKPQLVLLDIMMPGIDGYETCRRIKSSAVGPFVQVILVSGKGSAAERLQGYEAQADDYIVKPFNHDELFSKVCVHFRLGNMQRELSAAKEQLQLYADNLEKLVEQRTRQWAATQDMTVFALARLTDSRDTETGEHVLRMRYYAQTLAVELSRSGPYTDLIDDRFLQDLYRASPLHDIGKVAVPDAILQKPGRLTAEEYEVMNRYVLTGAETLDQAREYLGTGSFMDMAAEIARYHHEKFDGSGYCEGLCGQAIPLSARIVALADVYDALTSRRVYKPPMPPDDACQIILGESGGHFDPAIVEAFVRCRDEFTPQGEVAPWLQKTSHPSAVNCNPFTELANFSPEPVGVS